MEQQVCPSCHFPIQSTYYFCPNCGKKLKATPLKTDVVTQLGIYLLSFLLPPFGLWPAFPYLISKNKHEKLIGIIALVITVISIIVSIWISLELLAEMQKVMQRQLDQYSQLGL